METDTSKENTVTCPECNCSEVMVSGRCVTCLQCGWSTCSL